MFLLKAKDGWRETTVVVNEGFAPPPSSDQAVDAAEASRPGLTLVRAVEKVGEK
jgi:hypothetical protein